MDVERKRRRRKRVRRYDYAHEQELRLLTNRPAGVLLVRARPDTNASPHSAGPSITIQLATTLSPAVATAVL
jgi:hypothetical protein